MEVLFTGTAGQLLDLPKTIGTDRDRFFSLEPTQIKNWAQNGYDPGSRRGDGMMMSYRYPVRLASENIRGGPQTLLELLSQK